MKIYIIKYTYLLYIKKNIKLLYFKKKYINKRYFLL